MNILPRKKKANPAPRTLRRPDRKKSSWNGVFGVVSVVVGLFVFAIFASNNLAYESISTERAILSNSLSENRPNQNAPALWEPVPKGFERDKCPLFCGKKFEFEPFHLASVPSTPSSNLFALRKSSDALVIERAVGARTIFRIARPDYLERMAKAVEEIDKYGGFAEDPYCEIFDSCNAKDPMQSRHSETYLVCKEYQSTLASEILHGVATNELPGALKDEGDDNIMCQMARFVSQQVTKVIFPSVGWNDKKCIVQEFFVNQQKTGSHTKKHVHHDDSYGGIFYLDVPKGTRFCFSNSSDTKHRWEKYAPDMTEDLFPGAPHSNYPGYVEPRQGDIVLVPVGWLNHWVPRMEFGKDEKRTSVVFNMICF
jgi:hypothetical protein